MDRWKKERKVGERGERGRDGGREGEGEGSKPQPLPNHGSNTKPLGVSYNDPSLAEGQTYRSCTLVL